MQTQELPLSQIKVDWKKNCRSKVDDANVDDLHASIKQTKGLLTPLAVRKLEDGTYELISGFTRYKSLQQARIKTAPVVIREEVSDREYYFQNLEENAKRFDVHPADLAKRFAQLESGEILNEEGTEPEKIEKVSSDEIAKRLGMSKSHVTNLIRCERRLIPRAKQVWRKRDDATKFMIALTTYPQEEQQDHLDDWLAEKNKEKVKGRASEGDGDSASGKKASMKSIRDMMELLDGVLENEKPTGKNKAFWAGKVLALKFVLGDASRRAMAKTEYSE